MEFCVHDFLRYHSGVLPEKNWFVAKVSGSRLNIHDHRAGDIGIYDLFLHKRDVAYSIETLFLWLDKAGLHTHIEHFLECKIIIHTM